MIKTQEDKKNFFVIWQRENDCSAYLIQSMNITDAVEHSFEMLVSL